MSLRLRLEYGSDKHGWREFKPKFDDPENFTSVIAYVQAIEDNVLAERDAQARVIDAEGRVKAHIVAPYEGVCIDLVTDGATNLDTIRADYGIPTDRFAEMCRAWLEAHAE